MNDITQEHLETKKSFVLVGRDGAEIPCRIPPTFTLGEAKEVLAGRAGYEPADEEAQSFRLAVIGATGLRILPDHVRFADIEADAKFQVIPSLAPANARNE